MYITQTEKLENTILNTSEYSELNDEPLKSIFNVSSEAREILMEIEFDDVPIRMQKLFRHSHNTIISLDNAGIFLLGGNLDEITFPGGDIKRFLEGLENSKNDFENAEEIFNELTRATR